MLTTTTSEGNCCPVRYPGEGNGNVKETKSVEVGREGGRVRVERRNNGVVGEGEGEGGK